MKKFNNFTNKLAMVAMTKGAEMKAKAFDIFAQKEGEGFVDTALKILISVVVGALLLAGLYMLFEDTILPTLTERIENLFDYAG